MAVTKKITFHSEPRLLFARIVSTVNEYNTSISVKLLCDKILWFDAIDLSTFIANNLWPFMFIFF